MSNKNPVHSVQFGRLAPGIPVTDIQRSIEFYQDVLGMKKVFENGSPVGFAILILGEAEIHLSLEKDHKATSINVAHLMVDDASALYDHLATKNVRIVKGLKDAEYGLRQFIFADPDGNRIDVGQEI